MAGSREKRYALLPNSLPPRGLSREIAATYIGVSPGTFDRMVADGRMPKPKPIGGRRVWDRLKVDQFFEALPELDADEGPWSRVAL